MNCLICQKETEGHFVEEHTDPASGQTYQLYRCAQCGVVSSVPMRLPCADWYYKAFPFRDGSADIKVRWEYALFLSENIPHKGTLLDIGCGSGNFLLLAQRAGFRVSGIDSDARQIRKARGLGLRDVEQIDFEGFYAKRGNEKFNVIVLFGVLEHVEDPRAFIRKVREMLLPDGAIAVCLPNNNRLLVFSRELHDYPPHHFTRWTRQSLSGFLENNGFRVVTIDDSTLPFYCVQANVYSSLIKAFFGRWYGAVVSAPAGKKSGSLARVYPALRKVALVCIAPLAFIIWMIFEISRPGRGSDIYAFARKAA
ncbi:MAG: class I SAM-dependent methyltransferase [Candidatus Omnitrophica bacterium]|nr:class I SAM-dependent methyltransferase [Candidatus Omnitrophota bacterium]